MHRGKCRFGVASHEQAKKCDMAGFPRGQAGASELAAASTRAPPRSRSAAHAPWRHEQGKAGICGDRTINPRSAGYMAASPHSPRRRRPRAADEAVDKEFVRSVSMPAT